MVSARKLWNWWCLKVIRVGGNHSEELRISIDRLENQGRIRAIRTAALIKTYGAVAIHHDHGTTGIQTRKTVKKDKATNMKQKKKNVREAKKKK